MGSEAPSWADQWGEGGIGAIDEVNAKKDETVESKKKTTVFAGLGKAKAAAMGGIKWVKHQCLKKDTQSK